MKAYVLNAGRFVDLIIDEHHVFITAKEVRELHELLGEIIPRLSQPDEPTKPEDAL